jgi:hypothetical protein
MYVKCKYGKGVYLYSVWTKTKTYDRGQTRPLVKEDALRRQTLCLKRMEEPRVGPNTETDRLTVIFSVIMIWLYSGTVSEPTHFNTESESTVPRFRLHEHKQCHITENIVYTQRV